MHVGFTGTQQEPTLAQRNRLFVRLEQLKQAGYTHLHHGDCVGADACAHLHALIAGFTVVVHPPTNGSKRAGCVGEHVEYRPPKPYLERNHDIVDECKLLIACPKTAKEVLRSGTWATVRYARKKGIPVEIIAP